MSVEYDGLPSIFGSHAGVPPRLGLAVLALLHGLVLAAYALAPTFEVRLDAGAIAQDAGFAYAGAIRLKPVFPYRIATDTIATPAASRLRLSEDGRPLGPAHALHALIRQQGRGLYSHWGDRVLFSSSDSSDPRRNGRVYTISAPYRVSGFAPAFVALVDLVLILAFRRRLLDAARRSPWTGAARARALAALLALGRMLRGLGRFGEAIARTAFAAYARSLGTLTTASRAFGSSARGALRRTAVPGAARILRAPWLPALVLSAVPPAYLLLGPFQLFPPPGWVDAGMYLGYFLDYPRMLAEFGPNYHGARLPFTLAGYLAHRIFSPDAANYVLVLGFHELALFSVYFAVRPRHGSAAAVSAALFLAFNPLWIATVTRGYVDGPAMAFLFACLACLANRGRAVSARAGAVLAGAAAGLSASCNLMAGVVTVLTALAWLLAERPSRRELWRAALDGLAGVTAVTLALGLASWLLNGPFLFFAVNADFGSQALKGHGAYYRRPLGEWVPSAYRLASPLALLGTALIVRLGRRKIGPGPSLLAAGCGALILTMAWLLSYDIGIGGSTLQSAHYASYLLPGQCLVFGGLTALLRPAGGGRRAQPWIAVAAGIATAGIVPLLDLERLWAVEAAGRKAYLLWCVVALLVLAAAILMRRRATGLGLATLMLATALAGAANADTRRIFRAGANPDYRPFYHAMVRLHGIVESVRTPDRPLRVWYCRACFTTGDPERDRWLFVDLRFMGQALPTNTLDSMASLWMWNRSVLNYAMPSLSAEDVNRLAAAPQGSTLVLLCPKDAACAEAVAALRSAGIATHERARVPLAARGLFDLQVSILDVSREPAGQDVGAPKR